MAILGSASKLSWNLVTGVDWQFKKNMILMLGYRFTDIDYSRHSGRDEFGFDGQLRGPVLGLKILF